MIAARAGAETLEAEVVALTALVAAMSLEAEAAEQAIEARLEDRVAVSAVPVHDPAAVAVLPV